MSREVSGPLPLVAALFAAVAVGCGDNLIPAEQVGESQHFRFWIDPELALPVEVTPADVLRDLENNWTDMQTFLAMPEAKFDYYWLSAKHVSSICGAASGFEAGACQSENRVISDGYRPDHHELNHAYLGLRRSAGAIPFLAEGAAGSLGCGQQARPLDGPDVPWRSVVAAGYEGDNQVLYTQGARFVHHLITTRGIEAFVSYYIQAPGVRDADLFAGNFAAFWSRSLDDVWGEMLATPLDRLSNRVILPICPCSLPPVVLDGTVHPELHRNDYWRLPDLGTDTVELMSSSEMLLLDCAGETTAAPAQIAHLRSGDAEVGPLLARVTSPHYVEAAAHSLQGRRGRFIETTCEEAEVYDLPADQITGSIVIEADPLKTGSSVVYMQVRTPFPRVLLSSTPLTTCSTCAFDSPECMDRTGGGFRTIDGTTFFRIGPAEQRDAPTTQGTAQVIRFGDPI